MADYDDREFFVNEPCQYCERNAEYRQGSTYLCYTHAAGRRYQTEPVVSIGVNFADLETLPDANYSDRGFYSNDRGKPKGVRRLSIKKGKCL